MTDWTRFAAELGAIPTITDPALVRQKSRDFFWYSPILKAQLNDKAADLVVCPRNEADVVATVGLCARGERNPPARAAAAPGIMARRSRLRAASCWT